MKRLLHGIIGLGLMAAAASAWAHEEHAGGAHEQVAEHTAAEQTLTGEVVDVFCYLTHGKDGLGKGHADCAKKCIKEGLPVAIKVGDQLYLAAMSSHEPANKTLAGFAGERVSVSGKVLEQDGQHLISITQVKKAR